MPVIIVGFFFFSSFFFVNYIKCNGISSYPNVRSLPSLIYGKLLDLIPSIFSSVLFALNRFDTLKSSKIEKGNGKGQYEGKDKRMLEREKNVSSLDMQISIIF